MLKYSIYLDQLFLKNCLDTSQFNIDTKFQLEDLINFSNGSPGKLLKNIEILNALPDEITDQLNSPIKSSLKIIEISKLITEQLEIYQQICLVNLIQVNWWRKTKNVDLVKKLEKLKFYITKNIQPRLAWEIILLKISIKDV